MALKTYTHRTDFVINSFDLQIADDFDMPFFEVSCKNNINIEEAFVTLSRRIREYRETKVN